ncbi:hypothetical protein LQZ18_16670 [Lachnospiraceae bacterium ZAX-1]
MALSFAIKNHKVEYRIRAILRSSHFQKSKKIPVLDVWLLILSTTLLLFSFFYTFEAYNISSNNAIGTFTIDHQKDYFVLRENNLYDLYIDGKLVATIDRIPDNLSNLPVHNSIIEKV